MPGYKGHAVGGLVVFSLTRYLFSPLQPTILTSIEWFLCTLIGALVPDIDIKSKGQNAFYVLLAGGYTGALLTGNISWSPLFVALALFPMLVRHRGFSHTLWFVLAVSISIGLGLSVVSSSLAQAAWFDAFFVGIGMLSHLVLDRWISF